MLFAPLSDKSSQPDAASCIALVSAGTSGISGSTLSIKNTNNFIRVTKTMYRI